MRWERRWYGSGTVTVEDLDSYEPFEFGIKCRKPNLYVFGPGFGTDDCEDSLVRDRLVMADQLADYLNGKSERPKWIDDMERISETKLDGGDGSSIEATGPMVDANPPSCDWVIDPSPDAHNARARLIDLVVGIGV